MSAGTERGASAMADVAIIGFGFSGLAVLTHLAATRSPMTVRVIADRFDGLGRAYSTRDPGHLLNVRARKMGLWSHDPEGFLRWLHTPEGIAACAACGAEPPDGDGFAPRAVYGRYLETMRSRVLAEAVEAGVTIAWTPGRALALHRRAGGWSISTAEGEHGAAACVLATGNDPKPPFGGLDHARLRVGPWDLERSGIAGGGGPVVLIGSGLTAVDAVLTLRRLGYRDEILALSRNGLVPRDQRPELPLFDLAAEELPPGRRLPELVTFFRQLTAAGNDWRTVLDALRPHTATLWQRLSDHDRQTAIERWGALWSVHRHRMAPQVAEQIERELRSGNLRVQAVSELAVRDVDGSLELRARYRDEESERVVRPRLVIDCTGPQLDCARSDQPLLRDLVSSGVCRRHHTGLGLAAEDGHTVAPGLHAVGPLLTGQLWETVAVPELRDQAALIATELGGRPLGWTASSPGLSSPAPAASG